MNEPTPGPIRRTTTFLQGLVPGNGRSSREKKENMERLEAMMQKVLDEVELLKRMRLGARRKANGEMFRADMRNRISPPEDAALYIDEVRGDAANRERGESDEERMARIEMAAEDFEQERSKRMQMSEAIATETGIIRQTSKDVRHAGQPLPEGSQPFAQAFTSEELITPLDPAAVRRLTPLRVEGFGNPIDDETDLPPPIPRRPIVGPRIVPVEDVSDSPSNHSFIRGDEGMFNRHVGGTQAIGTSGVPTTPDPTRKISIKQPVGLPPAADEPLPSGSARESGVLGEHLEGQLGLRRTQSPSDPGDRRSVAPTPISKDEKFKPTQVPSTSTLPPIVQDFVQASTSKAIPPAVPAQSQYFIKDEAGRRQYFLGTQPPGTDQSSIFSDDYAPVEYTRGWKGKGIGSEIASEAEEASLNNIQPVNMNSPFEPPTAEPLPSLFAATQYQEGSPSRRLKKKTFRKPITAELGIKASPTSAVSAPRWPPLRDDREDLKLDSPGEKSRRSWKGLLSRKSTAEPQTPATLNRSSTGGEVATITYPGPSQEVKGKNGVESYAVADEDQVSPLAEVPFSPPAESRIYRDSMSDSIREDALYTLALRDELASGRHPASINSPSPLVQQWALQQEQVRKSLQPDVGRPVSLANHSKESTSRTNRPPSDRVIAGPFASPDREATPVPSEDEPLPKSLLVPNASASLNISNLTGYYEPTAPLSLQNSQSMANRPQSPDDYSEALYRAEVIKNAFKSSLTRQPTPPWPRTMPSTVSTRVPRHPSMQNPKPRKPTTLKDSAVTDAELAAMINGQTSPSKTESSYKTAIEVDGQDVPRQSSDGSRPPSQYSHGSIGGDVLYHSHLILT